MQLGPWESLEPFKSAMPEFFTAFFDSLYTLPLPGVIAWSVLENIVILVVVLGMGEFLVRRYQQHRVTDPPEPLTGIEIALAASCVVLNVLVTVVGVLLWQAGIIRVVFTTNLLRVVGDTLVLFLAMDLAMYGFHRAAHLPWLYPFIHQTHHRFENPRPLTLFVLNPFETLGFGTLWLILLVIYPATWLSIILYLTLNITFGLVGHLGVEPMPGRWIKRPISRYISTSTFHAEHHLDKAHNFGFYTLFWDHLFGTLSPDYADDFQSAQAGVAVQAEEPGRAN